MTQPSDSVQANPIRWSPAKGAPLALIFLSGAVVSFARLPSGLRIPVAVSAVVCVAVGVGALWMWGKGTELTRAGGELVLRSRWGAGPRVVARAGEHHGVRVLTPPGRSGPVPCVVWLDGSGRASWLTRGHRWPLADVLRLAAEAGISVADDDSGVMSFRTLGARYPGSASWAERNVWGLTIVVTLVLVAVVALTISAVGYDPGVGR